MYKVYSRTTKSQIGCTVFQMEEKSGRIEFLQYIYYIHMPKAKTIRQNWHHAHAVISFWCHKAKSLKLSWSCTYHPYPTNILFVQDHFLYENFPFMVAVIDCPTSGARPPLLYLTFRGFFKCISEEKHSRNYEEALKIISDHLCLFCH